MKALRFALLALAMPAVAYAQFDDGEQDEMPSTISVGANAPGMPGMNIRIDVNEGGRTNKKGEVKTEVKASSRQELSSDKPGESFRLVYEDDQSGKTSLRVLEPEGRMVRIIEDGMQRHADSIPTSVTVTAGKFYGVEVLGPKGKALFSKKFEAKRGMTASLWIQLTEAPAPVVVAAKVETPAPAPAAPACLGKDFASIREAVASESFSDGQLNVLSTAAANRPVCVDEVVQLLGIFNFSNDKLAALQILKPGLSDGQNAYKIYGAFDFDSDKAKAKTILGR